MSVIRETPYIEKVLATMSDSNLEDLRTVLNSGGGNVNLSFATLTAADYQGKVTPVYFQFEDDGSVKTGILIWVAGKTTATLICYHRFQDLMLIELDTSAHTFKKINEYCDINELRRVLDDTIEAKGVIESGGADANTVLTADGEGGTSWKAPLTVLKDANTPEGSAQYLLGLDSEGNVIKDELPEGIVVDQTVVEDSANAVSGGGVYDAIEDAKTAVLSDVADEYAPTADLENGTIVPEKSRVAVNIEPVSQASGSTQTAPFINQGTATNNNDAQAEVDTGTLGQHLEKQGNTVCVNQFGQPINSTYYEFNDSTGSFNDGVATFTATAVNGRVNSKNKTLPNIVGHKLLFMADIKTTTATNKIQLYSFGGYVSKYCQATTNWQTLYIISEIGNWGSDLNNNGIAIFDKRTSDWDAIQVKNVYCIDLTQWFNGNDNIPADLLANPDNFCHYYNGSLAYNTGQLVNCNGRYLVNGKQNVWDEEWELGTIGSNGANASANDKIRSKNYIQVIPNKKYYFEVTGNIVYASCIVATYDINKNFIERTYPTIPGVIELGTNVHYIRFVMDSVYGTTYKHDITISLYYEGEDYSEYVPYEAPAVYDTGTEVLYRIPVNESGVAPVVDSKGPNGTITSNILPVKPKELTWTRFPNENAYGGYYFISNAITGALTGAWSKKVFASGYEAVTGLGSTDKKISLNSEGKLCVVDSTYTDTTTFTNHFGNDEEILVVRNASVISQGTPFAENMDIDDMGNMMWLDTDNALVTVPQGCKIFYPAWYAGFIDTLGQREDIDWAPDEIVSQAQLGVVAARIPVCSTDTDGTYVLKATVASGTVTYAWVLEE